MTNDSPKKRKKKRPKPNLRRKDDRGEGGPPRDEYIWMNGVNGRGGKADSSPTGVPPGLRGISSDPELTVAWLLKSCRFAARS